MLAIPPAWTDVWICPTATGHIQAIGRDARGRKQYRYHARWRETRDATKYARLALFAERLPAIRRRVAQDLGRPGLPREKVLATVVRLLETSLIRVGNVEYAAANGSFGLTTLRTRHVRVEGSKLRFEFRGKGGKQHVVDVSDRRLARIVRQCQDLPGHELFQYVDDGRAAPDHRLGRRQRVPARGRRGRVHGQGLPDVGRHRPGRAGAAGRGLPVAKAEARRNARRARSRPSRSGSATRRPSAGSATCTRQWSTPTWIACCPDPRTGSGDRGRRRRAWRGTSGLCSRSCNGARGAAPEARRGDEPRSARDLHAGSPRRRGRGDRAAGHGARPARR